MAVEIRNQATLHTPLPPPLSEGPEKHRWERVKEVLHRPEFRFFLDEDLFLTVEELSDTVATVRLTESETAAGVSLNLWLSGDEGEVELALDDAAVRGLVAGVEDLRHRGELISILSCMDLGYVSADGPAEPFTVTFSSRNGEVQSETFDLTHLLNADEDGSTPFFGKRIKSGVEYALRVGRKVSSPGFDAGRLADTLGQLLMLYYFIKQRSL
jgi:hypothetical protein